MRTDLPTGTVTFLFTDVEGSTRLLHELGAEAYAVITPVPHLGLLLGPSLDYGVYTKNAGTTYEYGLSAGLFGEFW